ncbi:MAG: SUMF1/EgtB/PvdO family nonheme iron enzyme [Gammaproteobacteria bacterium]|nr:SUMF1/EgtB/PvdO family nonheme iron enzyme [Gammaproteobacteria bacterium]MBU1722715.1 SUMF1/EgtB/PvdO family nonheme iron enzyme [Gammaproteobacteria bacterium]MBU2005326.1 SUMF1/EgtB/PvdO family nonheme iron enzyme [Gammaproteobacteria bacterium]
MPHAEKGSAAVGLAYNSVIQIINSTGGGLTEDDIRQHEHQYLDYMMQDCMGLEWLRLVRKQDEKTAVMGLDAVYTPLLTTTLEQDKEVLNDRQQRRLSSLEVLNQQQRLVLTGTPGSGKSAFVSYLALCLAGENLGDKRANLQALTAPLPDKDGKPQTVEVEVDGKKEACEVRQPWDHKALIPVRIILRDFSASRYFPSSDKEANARCVLDFLHNHLQENCLEGYGKILEGRLRTGEALVMFDGLDEVPHAGERRKRLISCIDAFVKSFHKARFLVTCRPYAYEKAEWKLAGFAESHLADFNQGQIIRFIQQWYSHSPEFTADSATQRAGRLQRAVLGRDSLRKLGERPLLLSLIAYLDANRYELPERRADLYERLLDLLIDEWEKARFKANDSDDALRCEQHSLAEYLQIGQESIRLVLKRLAFQAHQKQDAGQKETADIAANDLVTQLVAVAAAVGRNDVKPLRLCEYLRDRVGILYQRGGATEMDAVYTFPHRSFQEYLAASYFRLEEDALFPTDTDFSTWQEMAAHLGKTDPDRWREVIVLAGGIDAQINPRPVWDLLAALYPVAEAPSKEVAWGLRLAGEILAENLKPDQVGRIHKPIFERIRAALPQTLITPHLPAIERAAIGRYLATIGDPRPEIMTVEAMQFCDIPAGKFWMGKGQYDEKGEELLPETPAGVYDVSYRYRMAKYPVTVTQFQQFVTATGFKPGSEDALRGAANAPVVYISQIEAMQFCQWLTQHLHDKKLLAPDLCVTLPDEAEWEKAARGGLEDNPEPQRRYPWGNEISDEHLNYNMAIVQLTTPGMYPQGASPYECEDMAGNVWEWTRSEYGEYPYPAVSTEVWKKRSFANGDRADCGLRGGAFYFDQGYVRSSVRYFRQDSRLVDAGFRCCVVPITLASETSGR